MRLFAFSNKNGDEIVSDPGTPFADLVRAAVEPNNVTYRSLVQRATGKGAGAQVSHTTLWKIAKGQRVQMSPELVQFVALAVDVPLATVQQAAAQEYTGLIAGDPLALSTPKQSVVVAYVPGAGPEDMPLVQDRLKDLGVGGDVRVVVTGDGGDE